MAAVTGTHTGSDDAAVLTDAAAAFNVDALIARVITNVTDGSSGAITDNGATTITATLTGGDNDWDTGDSYSVASLDFTEDTNLVKIMTQSPFTKKYDIRDYDDAEERATAWSTGVDAVITAAVNTLRANTDDFTDENVTTLEV